MIEIEADEIVLCACGSDLAVTFPTPRLALCAGCAADLERLEAWARANGWKALHLTDWILGPEGEAGWQTFLRHPGNAHLWPLALAKAGLASGAGV